MGKVLLSALKLITVGLCKLLCVVLLLAIKLTILVLDKVAVLLEKLAHHGTGH